MADIIDDLFCCAVVAAFTVNFLARPTGYNLAALGFAVLLYSIIYAINAEAAKSLSMIRQDQLGFEELKTNINSRIMLLSQEMDYMKTAQSAADSRIEKMIEELRKEVVLVSKAANIRKLG